jgi:hypothetical protein
VKRLALIAVLVTGCKSMETKMTMTPEQVISAIRDLADRGCECGTDKECFREIRTEWEQARGQILFNAKLLKGADLDAYTAERNRFGMCGDGAGLAVFDNV